MILKTGEFYFTNFDLNNHYEQNILLIEKYDSRKVWTAVLYDADNDNLPYIKRFQLDESNKRQSLLGENPKSELILLTDTPYPRLELHFAEPDAFRGPLEIDAEEFIAVKGFKAKGKRLTTFALAEVIELEPTRFPEPEDDNDDDDDDGGGDDDDGGDGDDGGAGGGDADDAPREKSDDEIRDELTGQLRLF